MFAELSAIVDGVTLILLAAGGYALVLLKAGTEAAVKTSAEEAAKATIQQLQWPAELARELQKTRGIERQELRFKSYGALWEKFRPLAIYDDEIINRNSVRDLSSKLSDWYFSECGGLLLTPQARDFYFALQDLLRTTAKFPEEWETDRAGVSEADLKRIFREVLDARKAEGAISALQYLSHGAFENWRDQAAPLAYKWKTDINAVAANWKELDRKQRFAILQQVGSILRTSLVTDLDSRLL